MSKAFRLRLPVVMLTAGLLVGASFATALAQSPPPVGGAGPLNAINPAVGTTPHTLVRTYIKSPTAYNPPSDIPSGYTALDTPTTIKCQSPLGCTIEAQVMGHVAGPYGSGWALCTIVNQQYLLPGCLFQGVTTGPNAYIMGNSTTSTHFPKGTYTVGSTVYVEKSSVLRAYHIDYRVYEP